MEWTGARYADTPTVEVQAWIAAPQERVWELVSDIALMPRMSSELQSVEWLDGATGPAPGARFVGRSKHKALGEWATTSHIVEFEPPRVFAWAKPLAAGLIGRSTAKETPRLSPPGLCPRGQRSSQTRVPVGNTARAMPVRLPCATRISRRFDPSIPAA